MEETSKKWAAGGGGASLQGDPGGGQSDPAGPAEQRPDPEGPGHGEALAAVVRAQVTGD